MRTRKYSKREEFTRDVAKLLEFCHARGYGVTFGEAHRTDEQQAIYVKEGKSKVEVSQHQKRLAIDLHIWDKVQGAYYISDTEWREVGEYWKAISPYNRWGGDFGLDEDDKSHIGWDRYHFERRG